ncbi:MAG: glycine C-acetyltransferase [Candidatus Neomarinimicrobiota bacterium]|nr:glycine C-acetyltransferase [Candidatus Neomarinimicrobiota bacterium]
MNSLQLKLQKVLLNIEKDGLYKTERIIKSQQSSEINVNEKQVLNFCANNYLGLSNNSEIIKAAKQGLEDWGFGLSSVRFICGTQVIHKKLEKKISEFLQQDDTILYTSCFDANGGLFETLLDEDDVIISDSLNHASIIDGIRLCKAKRYRYANSDMNELESLLIKSKSSKNKMIATDGVFSMDGYVAKLEAICDLAEKHGALVMVDDSHATGFFGPNGRGSIDYCNVLDRVDIITSTLGKAMGGASGGFTSGKKEIIEMLRQRSRPYLFSNSLAPVIVNASLKVLEILSDSSELRKKLEKNTIYFREKMINAGFKIKMGIHPIVPIMLGDAKLAKNMADDMLNEGIYVIGFSYPVVPKGEARIRVQISAGHSLAQLNKAIDSFIKVGIKHQVIN